MNTTVLAVCGLMLIPVSGFAQDTATEDSPPGPKTLQLKHILAPALTRPGGYTTALRPMTPILVVPQDFHAPLVCQRAPRITEALLNYFLKKPAPITEKYQLDDKALEEQKAAMAAHVNRAIGTNAVSAVYVLEGGKSMSKGVAARLPFAHATSCGPVLEEYEKRVMEILKEE